MADDFSERYGDLLTGSYACVDRISVLPTGRFAGAPEDALDTA